MDIKTKNKTYKSVFGRYLRSSDTDLMDVYNNPSAYKHRAEKQIKDEMDAVDGYRYRIIGYNCNTFSCGYMYDDEDASYFIYHTASNKRVFEVVKDEE